MVQEHENQPQHHQDLLISGIAQKYPNLKSLGIVSRDGMMPNLAPMNKSIHLSALDIHVSRRQIASTLRDVEIPCLREFEFGYDICDKGFILKSDFIHLKEFLFRHKKLTKLTLMISMVSYKVNEADRVKENSFDLIHFAIKNLKDLKCLQYHGDNLRSRPEFSENVRYVKTADGIVEFSK